MDVQIVLVPYDSGQRGVRMGAGPEHLRASGLEAYLAAHDLDTTVGRASAYAAPGGFSLVDLISLLSTIASRLPVSGLTISAYDPSCNRTGTVQEATFAAIASLLSAIDGKLSLTNAPHQAV